MAKEKNTQTAQINGRKIVVHEGAVGVYNSRSSIIFDIINYLIVGLASITTILPFIYVIGASFATEFELQTRPMFIIPHDVTLDAYKYIFASNKLLRAFGNSAGPCNPPVHG